MASLYLHPAPTTTGGLFRYSIPIPEFSSTKSRRLLVPVVLHLEERWRESCDYIYSRKVGDFLYEDVAHGYRSVASNNFGFYSDS